MPEMHPGFQQAFHGHYSHNIPLFLFSESEKTFPLSHRLEQRRKLGFFSKKLENTAGQFSVRITVLS
jgi:hypothetical protein